ncbi:uncharacterized protein LOC116613958 [Nematostella vectensis]|uniref:uncharacterized protein LOC116613958 n=1 Tax=Nematostella vectensis TaxID=45351 RepID=UPI00139057DE|nr:uncharacterized protein LOC116613958 [Nematostella vectensis]
MHLVIIHGYILSGTGSNVYTANAAKTWKRHGHSVTIVCQDPNAGNLPFVDEFYKGTDSIPSTPPEAGKIRVCVPDIYGLLLVYSYDEYPGYRVKTLKDCSIAEIEANIEGTVNGLRRVVEQGVDLILTNHILLSPVIASRATQGLDVPYVCKLHGSAIIFSVKPRLEELRPYVLEGLRNCKRVIAGTHAVRNSACDVLKGDIEAEGILKKIVIIPPGLDPNVFEIGEDFDKRQKAFLENVQSFINRKPNGRKAEGITHPPHTSDNFHDLLLEVTFSYNQRAIDADLIRRWKPLKKSDFIICYFGNFLDTKGVGELLTAFPRILDKVPEARLVLVGFGRYREHLEGMLKALKDGDLEAFKAYGSAGKFLDFPENLQDYFRQLKPDEQDRVTITGFQEHNQLKDLLPLASISVLGAKAAEAFGMVTIEAMAAGVLPLCHDHSGLSEVLEVVRQVTPDLEAMMRLPVRPGGAKGTADGACLIEQLPEKVEAARKFLYPHGLEKSDTRDRISAQLRDIAVSNFSWDFICDQILALKNLPDL